MPKTKDEFLQLLVQLLQSISEYLIISILLITLLIASYALWDLHDTGQKAQPEEYEIYDPSKHRASFEELIAINKDVFGWIKIYGTNIDYPVLQGEDNDKYLMTAADGRFQATGSIFLDYRNKRDFSDFNNIIYGHSMAYNAMFGDVRDFEEKSFYDEHKYGDLYFSGRHHGLKIIGFVQTDAYMTKLCRPIITTDDEKEALFEEMNATSIYPIDATELSYDYTYVLLYTCDTSTTNGRDLLICRLTDETYKDMFAGERDTKDKIGGARFRLRFFLIFLLLLALLIAIAHAIRKSEERERKKEKNKVIRI